MAASETSSNEPHLEFERILCSFPDRSYITASGDVSDDDDIIDTTHDDHFRSAKTHFSNWVMFENAAATSKSHEQRTFASAQAQTYRLGAIVFSATSLEAGINFFAKKHEIRHARDYEKSLSTLTKWQIYPEQQFGSHLPDHILGHVKRICRLRDQVVHPKPKWTSVTKLQGIPLFGPAQGAYMINVSGESLAQLFPEHRSRYTGNKFPNAHDWEKGCFIP